MMRLGIVFALAVLVCVPVACGDVVLDIANTGVDAGGVPLADNAVDPHWTVSGTGVAEGQGPDAIVAAASGGFPVGPWLMDDADTASAWITPAEDTSGPGATDGTAIYEFSTPFTTSVGGTVSIAGLQSADNGVVDVQVDGVSGTVDTVGFNVFADFSVIADVTGTDHTLSFFVHNGTGEATPDGPVGVRVNITEAGFTPIPEPSTLLLAVVGLLGLGLAGWRRRAA